MTPQVTELARALKYSPDLIYQYVHDNVQTLAEYGSMKGPLGPILDGNGTVFDQAELMQQLLLASEASNSAIASPQIAVGQVTLVGAQLRAWLGTSSAASIETILNAGGFPYTPSVSGDTMNAVTIEWAWVTVQISGTLYAFDPSTKSYSNTYPGFGVATGTFVSDTGYSQSTLTSALDAGSSSCKYQNTGEVVTCINPGFNTFLADISGYASTFAAALASVAATTPPQMMIGGNVATPLAIGTQLRQSTLPWQVAGSITSYTTIPSAYRTTFGVQMPGTYNYPSWNLSDVYGHRVTLSFSAGGSTATVTLGFANSNLGTVSGSETVLATSSTGVGTSAATSFATFIHHPYGITPANQTTASTVSDGAATMYVQTGSSASGSYVPNVFGLVVGVGPTGRGMVQKHTLDLSALEQSMPNQTNAEPVLGESLAVLGYTWLAERSQGQQVLGGASNTSLLVQQELGLVGVRQLSSTVIGPYLDIPTNTISVIQLAPRGSVGGSSTQKETGAFFTDAMLASALEGGVISQTQPGVPAISTTHLFEIAAYVGGYSFIDANNNLAPGTDNCQYWGNTLRPQLSGYQTADLIKLDSIVGYTASSNSCSSTPTTNRAVLTGYGGWSDNGWNGAGYFQISQNGTSIQSLITGNLSGGQSASNVTNSQLETNVPTTTVPDSQTTTAGQIGTAERGGSVVDAAGGSADLVTGSFNYSHTDLSVGSGGFPYELSFSRSYDSANRLVQTAAGNGWGYSLQSSAKLISDPFEALATTSAVAGAPAFAWIYAAQDLLTPTGSSATPSLAQIIAGATAIDVFVGDLTNNAVAVTTAGGSEHFVSLLNGSYAPPIGSSDILKSNSTGYWLQDKHLNATQFDSSGNMLDWMSPAGATVTVKYQSYPTYGEVPTSVSNNMGRTLTFTQTSTGQLASVTDGNSRTVKYAYDSNGDLTTVTDPTSQVTTFAYDGTLHLTGITTPSSAESNGTVTATIGYDSLDRYKTFTDPLSRITSYYFAGSRSEIDDPAGDATVTYLNPDGLDVADVDPIGNMTTHAYDALDRQTKTTNPEGNYTTYSFDAKNNLLRLTDTPKPGSLDYHDTNGTTLAPRSKSWTYHATFNEPLTATDFAGNVTSFAYRSTGKLATVTLPPPSSGASAQTTTYTYDSYGRLLTVSNPDGRVDTDSYDSDEDLTTAVTDSGSGHLNITTTLGYDAIGNQVSAKDPDGNTTTTAFDSLRRPTTVTPPGDAQGNVYTTTYAYDPNGHVHSATKQLPKWGGIPGTQIMTYTYDAAAEVTQTAESTTLGSSPAAGDTVSYTYDAAGRVKTAVQNNPNGLPSFETQYDDDADGRVLLTLGGTPGSLTVTEGHSYDPNGTLSGFSYYNQGNYYLTTYLYDGFDRLGVTTFPDGTQETSAYTADNDPNYFVTRSSHTITATYDPLHRVTQKTGDPTVSYTYDAMSRLASAAVGSSTWNYSYDTAGRLSAEVQPGIAQVQYSPDPNGNIIIEQVNPIGTTSGPASAIAYMTYDALNRPLSFATVLNQQKIFLWSDQYDALGRVTARTRQSDGSASLTDTWTYNAYGMGNDLTQVVNNLSTSEALTLGYLYDSTHRATGMSEVVTTTGQTTTTTDMTAHPGAAGTTSWSYNNLNQLVFAACSASTPCYTADGELGYDGSRSLTYDQEGDGRIATASVGSTTASYGYDWRGRRVSKTVNGNTTSYVLNPAGDEIAEISRGAMTRSYFYAAGGMAPVAAVNASGTIVYTHTDRIGSVVAVTSGGNVAEVLGYLPYGGFTNPGQTTGATPFGYGGYRWDPEIGAYHTRTRSYDPNLARFLQADPSEYGGGRNMYAYVMGDPVDGTDPSGLDGEDDGSGNITVTVPRLETAPDGDPVYSSSVSETIGPNGQMTVTGYYRRITIGKVPVSTTKTVTVEATPPAPTVVDDTLNQPDPSTTASGPGPAASSEPSLPPVNEPGAAPVYPLETLAMGGAGLARAVAVRVGVVAVEGAEVGMTTLFRAVTTPELESIQSTGAFSNPIGIESKYFSTNLGGAQSYASQAAAAFGDGPFSFVRTSIPTGGITPSMTVTVDSGIQTVVVPTAQLPGLSTPTILPH